MKGKLIVIDGSDGSGKATQAKYLVERLKKDGKKVETIDFPRYYDNFFGKFIGDSLAGKYGSWLNAEPHLASIAYASDRFESKPQIQKWLDEGTIVVADRYVSANQIHQGSKISDEKERQDFLEWLDKMEYGVFGLPKADMTFFLHVPFQVSLKNLQGKNEEYTNKKKDQHEGNPDFLKNSEKAAQWVASQPEQYWTTIECCTGDDMRTRDDIHEEIYNLVKEII